MNPEVIASLLSSFATAAKPEQQRVDECQRTLEAQIAALPDVTLSSEWVFWLDSTTTDAPRSLSTNAYLKGLKMSASLSTLKSILSYALTACDKNGKVMLFKQGVKPLWEDRTNFNGGRFHLCCVEKQQTIVSYLVLIAKVLAQTEEDQILPEGEQNGFVCTLKPGSLGVELWNKTAKKKEKVKNARKSLKKLYKRNILYYVHRTSVNIQKFGIDSVLPIIEEKKEERAAKKEEKKEASNSAPATVERVVIPTMEKKEPFDESIEKEKQAQATSCAAEANKQNLMDALNTALLSAALTNAWSNRETN